MRQAHTDLQRGSNHSTKRRGWQFALVPIIVSVIVCAAVWACFSYLRVAPPKLTLNLRAKNNTVCDKLVMPRQEVTYDNRVAIVDLPLRLVNQGSTDPQRSTIFLSVAGAGTAELSYPEGWAKNEFQKRVWGTLDVAPPPPGAGVDILGTKLKVSPDISHVALSWRIFASGKSPRKGLLHLYIGEQEVCQTDPL